MRPKGAKGEVDQPPNHKWAHLSQFWAPNPSNPELAKTTLGPKMAKIQSMDSGNHQRPPAQLQVRISLKTKLRDSKSSPQSITNFRGSFSYFSLAIPRQLPEDNSRTPTTWPYKSWVVNSHQDYSMGNSQMLSIISIIVKASITQRSLDNSIGPYR
ncbi:hypothetical protein O181_062322 [Austropuccinia psidii MF-1]|uniref:Uncharacterized protein n=1 Tax=Austropuccinia psidii MF-1 TaxID=1389203 RepID=A0A9Q3EMF6_9BASI|nr:hypothetical protein [Austropuccinia psidii MF-1]